MPTVNNYQGNAWHVTLHDLSGAPINQNYVDELEAKLQEIMARDKGLVVSVTRT